MLLFVFVIQRSLQGVIVLHCPQGASAGDELVLDPSTLSVDISLDLYPPASPLTTHHSYLLARFFSKSKSAHIIHTVPRLSQPGSLDTIILADYKS